MLGLDQGLGPAGDTILAVAQSTSPNLLAFLKPDLAGGMPWVQQQFWNGPQSQPRPPFCFYLRVSGLLGGA